MVELQCIIDAGYYVGKKFKHLKKRPISHKMNVKIGVAFDLALLGGRPSLQSTSKPCGSPRPERIFALH